MPIGSNQIKDLDQLDKTSTFRKEFYIHDSSLIYLDGNSLGRLPKKTIRDINNFMLNEWGNQLVNGWENWIITSLQISGLRKQQNHYGHKSSIKVNQKKYLK